MKVRDGSLPLSRWRLRGTLILLAETISQTNIFTKRLLGFRGQIL
jgi:hypothetical protein